MDGIYTFNEDEKIGKEIANKLNTTHSIKEIKFEFDHEITKDECNNLKCLIWDLTINFIQNTIEYNSNFIVIKCSPFKYLNRNIEHGNISLFNKNFNEEHKMHVLSKKNYIKCHITLKENSIFITCRNKDDEENIQTKIILSSNYFTSTEELKLYFINWTETNEQIYNDWFNEFINKYDSEYIIYLHNINSKIDIKQIYEKEGKIDENKVRLQ